MSRGNTKILFRMFTIASYEKEARFLTEQHCEGFKFVEYIWPCFYRFERCEPENVIYQLDFSVTRKKDRPEYVQMFQDCGWEYIQDYLGWYYFRKELSEEEVECSIFSDIDSKFELLDRIYKSKIIPLMVVFFSIIIPQLWLNMRQWIGKDYSCNYNFAFAVLYSVFLVIYLLVFVGFGVGLYRLKKKILDI